jgi:hypothetical protein
MIRDAPTLLTRLRAIHEEIRDHVVAACEQTAIQQLSHIVADQAGDVVYAIDRVSEEVLLRHFEKLGHDWSFVLIAEGVGEDGVLVFPPESDSDTVELRIIIDPIDGTRGLMYQKRPAWILTGVAPNRGSTTSLADIEIALQTEIPLVKQHLSDSFWALAEQGIEGERFNRMTQERHPLFPQPSQANTIEQGYGSIARFFPGGRAELAAIDDEVVLRILGPIVSGKVQAFEDQYISTGGQLYELLAGHDRWIADFRPLLSVFQNVGLCCHPYDLCTELIARLAGIIVTDEQGQRLSSPLDVTSELAWMGFANTLLYQQVAPVLHTLLQEHALLASGKRNVSKGENDVVVH